MKEKERRNKGEGMRNHEGGSEGPLRGEKMRKDRGTEREKSGKEEE